MKENMKAACFREEDAEDSLEGKRTACCALKSFPYKDFLQLCKTLLLYTMACSDYVCKYRAVRRRRIRTRQQRAPGINLPVR